MNYSAFRVASAVFGVLPEWAVRRLGHVLGRIAWIRAEKRRDNATRAMARVLGEVPDQPSAQSVDRARSLFESYGRYWAETFWIRPRRVASISKHVEVEGVEHFRNALANGTGVIFALPHVGNWEVAGTVAIAEGAELLAVAEKLKDQRIVDWFVGLRKELGIDVVIATGREKVFETCSDALRRNAAVALLADRNLSGRGVLVSFFGEETRLPVGPARLALETGAPIVPVGSFFQDGRGHRVSIKAPVPVAADDDVASLTKKVGTALEDLIREAPEQWHMVQPNWPSDRRVRP